jgi:hypothetical protein
MKKLFLLTCLLCTQAHAMNKHTNSLCHEVTEPTAAHVIIDMSRLYENTPGSITSSSHTDHNVKLTSIEDAFAQVAQRRLETLSMIAQMRGFPFDETFEKLDTQEKIKTLETFTKGLKPPLPDAKRHHHKTSMWSTSDLGQLLRNAFISKNDLFGLTADSNASSTSSSDSE